MKSEQLGWTRRGFLGAMSAALAGSTIVRPAKGDKQRSGQAAAGTPATPKWENLVNVTVGRRNADLVGNNEKVIQAAVDYIAGWGGGTVHILPGTYHMRNSVSLRSGVRIIGSGQDSVLIKEPEVKTKLAEDSESWQREVVVADP